MLPCKQLVSLMPNEKETTASNRLLFHWACVSSTSLKWCVWCQFHLLIKFTLELFRYKWMQISRQKCWQKSNQTFDKVLYLVSGFNMKPNFRAFLPSFERDCWALMLSSSLNTTFETIWVLSTIESGFAKARWSDWASSKLKKEVHWKHQKRNSSAVQHSLEELWNVFQQRNPDS